MAQFRKIMLCPENCDRLRAAAHIKEKRSGRAKSRLTEG